MILKHRKRNESKMHRALRLFSNRDAFHHMRGQDQHMVRKYLKAHHLMKRAKIYRRRREISHYVRVKKYKPRAAAMFYQ